MSLRDYLPAVALAAYEGVVVGAAVACLAGLGGASPGRCAVLFAEAGGAAAVATACLVLCWCCQ